MTPRILIDLVGRRYGLLTVIEFMGKNRSGQSIWKCRCECGREKIIQGASITRGSTKSCGGPGCMREARYVRIPGYCNGVPGYTVKLNMKPFPRLTGETDL